MSDPENIVTVTSNLFGCWKIDCHQAINFRFDIWYFRVLCTFLTLNRSQVAKCYNFFLKINVSTWEKLPGKQFSNRASQDGRPGGLFSMCSHCRSPPLNLPHLRGRGSTPPPFKCTQFECLTRQFSPQLKLIPNRKIIAGLTRTLVTSVKRKNHSGQVEKYACNVAFVA